MKKFVLTPHGELEPLEESKPNKTTEIVEESSSTVKKISKEDRSNHSQGKEILKSQHKPPGISMTEWKKVWINF